MTTARQALPGIPDATRSDWIDIAKGLGILLVVYGHVARGLFNGGVPMDPWWFTTVDSAIYAFHMPLFFLLSGWFFVGSLTRRGPRDYLAGRIATVLWPYVLWSLLQGGIELLMSRWTSKPVTLAEVLALGWTPRAQFWFLYALFLMSLMGVAMCWRRPKAGVAVLTLTGAALMALQHRDWPMPAALVSSHLLYFAIGAWLGAQRVGIATARRLAVIGVLLGGIAVIALQSAGLDLPKLMKLAEATLGLSAACVLAIALAGAGNGAALGQGLAALGRASMAIFLAHILVASGVRIVLAKVFGISNPWPHLIVGIAAGTLLPWWLWRAVQGRPAMVLFELPVAWRRRLAGTGQPRREAVARPS